MEITKPSLSATETLVELWLSLAAGQREYGSHLLVSENRTRIRDSLSHHIATGTVLVAGDDPVCGFVTFTVETGSYAQDVRRGLVENLYVESGSRNEGVGTALLEAAEAELRSRDVDVVALDALAENDEAREFYQRRGYRPHRLELEKPMDAAD